MKMKNTNKISGFILLFLLLINVTGFLCYKHEINLVDKKTATGYCLAANSHCEQMRLNSDHTYLKNQIKLKYEKMAIAAFFIEGFVIVTWNEILKRRK
jgi:hypothetical protein